MRNLKNEIKEYFNKNVIENKDNEDFENSYVYFISSKRKIGNDRGRVMGLDFGVPDFDNLKKGELRAIANALKCKNKVLFHRDNHNCDIFILADSSKVFLKNLVRTEDNSLYSLEDRDWMPNLNVNSLERIHMKGQFYLGSYGSYIAWNIEHMTFSSLWKACTDLAKIYEENGEQICDLISNGMHGISYGMDGILDGEYVPIRYKDYHILARKKFARRLKIHYMEYYIEKC